MRRISLVVTAVLACLAPSVASATAPPPAHVIVIVEENKSLAQIDGNGSAPYINALARRGAFFTHAHGVTHPSLPNYLALFSGLTNDNGDGCPATGIDPHAANLGSELIAAHRSFAGFSEALPHEGSTVCAAGKYARKHAPWVAFDDVPATANRPLTALPPYDALPTVSFIIPNVDDDMHDGSIAAGDDWLETHVDGLVRWADTHDSLVIVTWDEGYDRANTIPTIFVGPMVRPGRYVEPMDHLRVLRTISDLYGLHPLGHSRAVLRIQDCWKVNFW